MENGTDQQITETPAPQPRKVHIETWGCQMNVADSERMLSLLQERNYTLTNDVNEADLVLLNTCHIREKAKQKILSRLGVLRELKEQRPGMKIAVSGCVAQAEGAKLIKSAPQIDVLLGPGKIDDLTKLLDEQQTTGRSAYSVGFKSDRGEATTNREEATRRDTPTLTGKNEVTRFVNIIQGCDNFCTFCVVPFTRGREISRPATLILDEAKNLVAQGAREIMLLGQNVNSYGHDLIRRGLLTETSDGPFVDLLRKVADIPGLDRLRFTTSNPHDFSPSIAKLFKDHPKLGRYIHFALQSGNDRILAEMRRKVTAAEFLERVSWLRAAIPDMAISTDLIVGFPGETEAEFEDTLAIVEKVQFSFAYSFMYSPRKGTAAARFADQVPEDVKERRLARLNKLLDSITIAQHQAEIGQVREVLFLYESRKEPGCFYGRTEHFRLVRAFSSENIIGKTLAVQIDGANKTALTGKLCSQIL